jgi:hypothetical protein
MRKDVTVLGKLALNITHVPTFHTEIADQSKTSTSLPDKIEIAKFNRYSECFFDAIKHLVPMVILFLYD